MKFYLVLLLILSQGLVLSACSQSSAQQSVNPYCLLPNKFDQLRCQLAKAQLTQNLPLVEKVTRQMIVDRGTQAGVPDRPDSFLTVDPKAVMLSRADIHRAFTPYGKQLEKDAWWRSKPAPTELKMPLRALASVITGSVSAKLAGADYPDRLLRLAKSAGDYLLWAQNQGETGGFPFPANQQGEGRPMKVATEFLRKANQAGKLAQVLHNHWIVDDLGNGDLQFDNGVCGVAMLQLYQATQDEKYLQSAIASAEWAMKQPVVPNWNYNSFSVYLLAYTYQITGDRRYLDSAKKKARLGIYPGQLKEGINKGHWVDPHNARLVYHYILIRGLGALVAVLPADDPDFIKARHTLALALRVGNKTIINKGVANPETVLEVLSELQLWLPPSSTRLGDEGRRQALNLVGRYSSFHVLQGKLTVAPGAWGLFLQARQSLSE